MKETSACKIKKLKSNRQRQNETTLNLFDLEKREQEHSNDTDNVKDTQKIKKAKTLIDIFYGGYDEIKIELITKTEDELVKVHGRSLLFSSSEDSSDEWLSSMYKKCCNKNKMRTLSIFTWC